MGKLKTLNKTIDQVARELAEEHVHNDVDTIGVYLARDPDQKEIRLVEITNSVGTTGEVLPFRFKAQPKQGVPYPSTIILLSKEEWKKIRNGKLRLPEGWEKKLECLYEKTS